MHLLYAELAIVSWCVLLDFANRRACALNNRFKCKAKGELLLESIKLVCIEVE